MKKVTLCSVDARVFEFDEDEMEALAVESIVVKVMVYNNRDQDRVVPVGSRALEKVIDYCYYQAEKKTGKKMTKKEPNKLEEEEEEEEEEKALDEEEEKAVIKDEEKEYEWVEEGTKTKSVRDLDCWYKALDDINNDDDDDGEDTDEELDPELVLLSNLLIGTAEAEPAIVDDTVKRWINDVLELGQGMLCEVITAADDLRIASLLDLVCPLMLKMIRGKDEAHVYEIFNMKMEYTDEEIEDIINENKLMLLPRDEEQQ